MVNQTLLYRVQYNGDNYLSGDVFEVTSRLVTLNVKACQREKTKNHRMVLQTEAYKNKYFGFKN